MPVAFASRPPTARRGRSKRLKGTPSMLKKNPRLRPVSGAFRVFSLAGCGGNSIDSAKASDADPRKDRTGGRCARGRKRCPHHRRQGGRRHLSDHRRFQLEHVQDCGRPAHRGKRLHALRDDAFRHGLRQALHGTGDEAAAASEADFIPYVEKNAEGKYTYDVPVEALDEDTACAAWSIRKEQWYDRTLVFESAGVDLRADALK